MAALAASPVTRAPEVALHELATAATVRTRLSRRTTGMRTVVGPTDRVVVVGAGLGGLSAALRLAGGRPGGDRAGARARCPGGRAGLLELGGYAFDTGPTVLTMPDLIADALDAVGERLEDWLDLQPVDPLYRAYYPDGSTLDVHADVEAMAAEVERVCGPAEAAGYRRFVDFVARALPGRDARLHRPQPRLAARAARPRPAPAAATAAGSAGWPRKVARYLKDPRTQRVFSFQAMYAGLSPYDALAIYAVIAYMDSVAGVCFPRGGMHAVPRALAGAAEKHGVRFRYGDRGRPGRGRRRPGQGGAHHRRRAGPGRRRGAQPRPAGGLPGPAAAGSAPRRVGRLRYSPSCFLLLAGSTAAYTQDRAPQHPLRPGLAAHVRRDHRRRAG